MNQGDVAIERGDIDGALAHDGAAATAVPGNAEMVYWQAVALAGRGEHDQARPLFEQAFAADPAWRELTRRLPGVGLLPDAATQRVLGDDRP